MARNRAGLEQALREIPALREEFWANVNVPGLGRHRSTSRSSGRAGWPTSWSSASSCAATPSPARRAAAATSARSTSIRTASASATTRNFAHVAAWEYQGEGKAPIRNVEPLNYEFVKMSVRNYK